MEWARPLVAVIQCKASHLRPDRTLPPVNQLKLTFDPFLFSALGASLAALWPSIGRVHIVNHCCLCQGGLGVRWSLPGTSLAAWMGEDTGGAISEFVPEILGL